MSKLKDLHDGYVNASTKIAEIDKQIKDLRKQVNSLEDAREYQGGVASDYMDRIAAFRDE